MTDPTKIHDAFDQLIDESEKSGVNSESMNEPSPTGQPLAEFLKGDIGKVIFGLLSCGAIVLPLIPQHTVFAKVLSIFVGLGGALGILSPGLRKPNPDA